MIHFLSVKNTKLVDIYYQVYRQNVISDLMRKLIWFFNEDHSNMVMFTMKNLLFNDWFSACSWRDAMLKENRWFIYF